MCKGDRGIWRNGKSADTWRASHVRARSPSARRIERVTHATSPSPPELRTSFSTRARLRTCRASPSHLYNLYTSTNKKNKQTQHKTQHNNTLDVNLQYTVHNTYEHAPPLATDTFPQSSLPSHSLHSPYAMRKEGNASAICALDRLRMSLSSGTHKSSRPTASPSRSLEIAASAARNLCKWVMPCE